MGVSVGGTVVGVRVGVAVGGTWVEVPLDQAHVCENLVTAPAWPAHPLWLAKFLELLGTKISHG